MKYRYYAFVVAAALFICAGAAIAADTLDKPEKFDEEEILTGERLSKYDTIVVRNFSTEGAELVNMDEEEKAKLKEYKDRIVKALHESTIANLKEKTKFAVIGNGKAKGHAIILEGKFVMFNAGHAAAKFFLGWMAPKSGKTSIGIEAKIVEAKSGKVLASFKDVRAGGEGASMGTFALGNTYLTQATDEGEEIAEFIEKLY